MAEVLNFNIFNLSTESLMMVVIIILVLNCYGVFSMIKNNEESLVPWDTYNARFQQGRDDMIGATPAGDDLRTKLERHTTEAEGLVSGFNPPTEGDNYMGDGLPEMENVPDIERTEGSLERTLHGL